MKKLFAASAVLMLVLLLFVSTAAAEQFDGFSIDFPADFAGAYTDVDSETASDFFTETLAYETESDYELMQVLIGESANLESLFSKDFGFANRQDLDLSLLTEDQLAKEAEALTAYIDKSFPLYMTYVTPKSMMVDDRLCLIVTGYYTDYQGGLTGEFRAYEFYYMGQVIIIYYDTQIEGTYFVESVFDLPDSIVETLDFDLNPAAQPMNASLYKDLVAAAAPVGGFLAVAVLLGALFGLMFRKSPNKDDDFGLSLDSDTIDTKKTKSKKAQKTKEEPPAKALKENKPAQAKTSEPAAPVLTEAENNEAVDWASMLSTLKKDTDEEKKAQAAAKIEHSEPVVQDSPAAADVSPASEDVQETPKSENKVLDERAPRQSIEAVIHADTPEPPPKAVFETEEIPPVEVSQNETDKETDPLLAQLQAMDDMSAEISAALGNLESLSSAEGSKDAPISESAKPKTLDFEDIDFTTNTPELDLPKSKNAESVSENYQSYLNNLLPTRKKPKKADENTALTDDLSKDDTGNPAAAPVDTVKQDKAEISFDDNKTNEKSTGKPKKEKKQGVFSKMLSSVADRIERDGEENTEPEFDSRTEMHIREKTERHSVEKLMPGLFDDGPEEEPVEILLDQSEDLKFERSKSKPKQSDAERSKQVKSRVDNLFND